MRKYKDAFWNVIYNDSVIEKTKDLDDCSVDLILSDPPYNIDYNNNRRVKTREDIHGIDWILNDVDNEELIEKSYKEYFRILKEGSHIYIFSRWDVTEYHMDILKEQWFEIKNNLIWMKNSWSMWDLYGDYAWQYENIIFWYKPFSKWSKKGKWNKLNPIWDKTRHSNILQYDRVVGKNQKHVHQKPVDLLKFLIEKSSKIWDTIYDGFLWSNSLWLAAMSLFRKYSWTELWVCFSETVENTDLVTNEYYNFFEKWGDYNYFEQLKVFAIKKDLFKDFTEYKLKVKGKNKNITKEFLESIISTKIEYKEYYIFNI